MNFPSLFGPNAFGLSENMVRRFALLIRQLGGDGYDQDEDSLRFNQLLAEALAPAVGDNTLKRALNQAFLLRTTEALRDWELEYGLPNDSARSTQERQLRVALQRRLMGEAVFADWVTNGFDDFGVTSIQSPTAAIVLSEACEEETAFNVDVLVTGLDIAKENSVADALRRIIPVKSFGHHSVGSIRSMIVEDIGAVWDSPVQKMGRTALRIALQGPVLTTTHEPSRIISYGPATAIRAKDLKDIQRALLWHDASGSTTIALPGSDGVALVVEVQIGTSATVVLDNVQNWRDRMITGNARSDTLDIRAGQGDDNNFGSADLSQLAFITLGGGPNSSQVLAGETDLTIGVNAATGDLELVNSSGVNTYNVVIMLWATGKFGIDTGSADVTAFDFTDGTRFSAGGFNAQWGTGVFDASALTRSSPSGPALMPRGGVHRLAFIIRLDNVGGTVNDPRRVDTRVDWRDRYVTVMGVLLDNTGDFKTTFPGSADDDLFRIGTTGGDGGAQAMFFSGPGGAAYEFTIGGSTHIVFEIDASDGALDFTLRSTHPSIELLSAGFILVATEQLNEYVFPGSITGINPGNGSEVIPRDLNTIQDVAIMSSPRRDLVTRDLLPLGRIADNLPVANQASGISDGPSLAYDAELRGVRVDARLSPETLTRTRRRFVGDPFLIPHAGGIIHHFAIPVNDQVISVIDDTADWRDRFIIGLGRTQTGGSKDIWPGGADEADHNAPATLWSQAAYLGPGSSEIILNPAHALFVAAGVALFAGLTDGKLYVANNAGGATNYTITGMIRASPKLGPRTDPNKVITPLTDDDGFNGGFGPP